MRGARIAIYAAGAFLSAMSAGCSGNECYENHSALPLASFFNSATLQPVTLQRLEIYGIGAPGDSVLYTPQGLKEAYLPFRLWQDSTSYVFVYGSLVSEGEEEETEAPADTLTFFYTPREWFVSPACGAMYFYEIRKVAHTSFLIDSISYSPLITNENISNIKIFFRQLVADE